MIASDGSKALKAQAAAEREGFDALLSSGGDRTRKSEEEYRCLLGIVRSVASNLSGTCDLASSPDGGATFSLYLANPID